MLAQIEITPASDEWWGPYLGFNYSPWAGLYVHSIPFHDVFHVGHSNAHPKGGGGGTACDESYQRIPDGEEWTSCPVLGDGPLPVHIKPIQSVFVSPLPIMASFPMKL